MLGIQHRVIKPARTLTLLLPNPAYRSGTGKERLNQGTLATLPNILCLVSIIII